VGPVGSLTPSRTVPTQTGTNIDNQSVDGWMKGTGVRMLHCRGFQSRADNPSCTPAQATTTTGMAITHKTCLILDEVDGMSGGDRGGVGAMNALIKKTRVSLPLTQTAEIER
jgi:replication factor C subunit 1